MTNTDRLVLHWSPRSPYVRLVTVAALECGLADRIDQVRTLVGTYRDIPEGYSDNPLGKIPTLVLQEGTSLYDSRVITTWMIENGPTGAPLSPADSVARMIALRRQSLGIGVIDQMVLCMAERLQGRDDPASDLFAVTHAKLKQAIDGIAAEAVAMAGAPFDLGQLAIGCALAYAEFRFPELVCQKDHPALDAWYKKVSARPSFTDTAFRDDS